MICKLLKKIKGTKIKKWKGPSSFGEVEALLVVVKSIRHGGERYLQKCLYSTTQVSILLKGSVYKLGELCVRVDAQTYLYAKRIWIMS
jgi:hypothetical protein